MLQKKQGIKSNQEWLAAFEKSTELYSKEYINDLEKKTIEHIKKVSAGFNNICNGWIAGKDSIVLHHILKKSGIKSTPIMWRGINEYPCMIDWIKKNKPENLVEEVIDKFNFDFLEKNPTYLFMQGDTRQKWMSVKWRRQKADIKKHNFDLFIVARRLKDGNQCGLKTNDFVVDSKGYKTYSPLAEWNHEEMFAYIKYNKLELPPFYNFKRGFLVGSVAMGEWTEYAVLDLTENDVWNELWKIDKNIVINASKHLTSARNYINQKKGADMIGTNNKDGTCNGRADCCKGKD